MAKYLSEDVVMAVIYAGGFAYHVCKALLALRS
jgi:hypothetical protein